MAMERPSALLHRECVPWQKLLLAVSLLTFWHLPITAQLSIKSEPFNATQGKDVLLSVYNASVNVSGYQWYRGERVDRNQLILQYEMNSQMITRGPQYSGREEIFSNGSLLLRNVSQDDAGFYTVQTVTGIETDQAIGQFRVFLELPKPFITSNNSDPMEGENSVTLICEPETPDTTYRWWINGTSLPDSDRIALTKDNRTLTLLNVTRNDTGPYECETQNPVSTNRSDPVSLNVSYGPDPPTISPPDSNYRPGSNLSLSCHAASNPPAQYSWFLPGRPQQSTQVLFIPNIHANDSGSYICLAHNSVTGLNRTTVKNITVLEPVPKPSLNISNTTVTEEDSVVLICVSYYNGTFSTTWLKNNKSLVIIKDRMTLSPDNRTLTINPVKKEDEGEYQCAVSNSVSFNSSDPVALYVRSNPKPDNGLSDGAIAGIVIGVLAGVALIAGLVYCLFFKKTRGASDQHHLTEHKPSDSNNSQGHSDNSLNKTDDVAYSSLNFDAQKSTQPTLSPSSTATETIYSEVKKK